MHVLYVMELQRSLIFIILNPRINAGLVHSLLRGLSHYTRRHTRGMKPGVLAVCKDEAAQLATIRRQ